MKYCQMSKNYIFREFKCKLSIEQTAELCFKSVRSVKQWDKGQKIPDECKRLMKFAARRPLHHTEQWEQFEMQHDKLMLPTGQLVSPQEILTGIALLSIQSELELKIGRKLLKFARAISRMKK